MISLIELFKVKLIYHIIVTVTVTLTVTLSTSQFTTALVGCVT